MAFGTDHIVTAEVPNFIPELWSDEVIAVYKTNTVAASRVRVLNHRGKKGDTIKIPTPARGSASAKAADTIVTFIAHGTDAGVSVSIDKHKEYSRLIEDIVDVQALESLRRFYTDDGGYAIAKQVDSDILVEFFRGAGATINWTQSTNTIATTSTFATAGVREGDGTVWDEAGTTDISDAGIRTFIKLLDDNDVPFAERCMIIPTIVKQDLLGLARFTEEAFVGERAGANSVRNGIVGNVYGMEVYVSTNCPLVEDGLATADNVAGYVVQRDSLVLVEQLGVRSQSQYKQEYLADLFTVDMIYGTKLVRESNVVTFVVPTT